MGNLKVGELKKLLDVKTSELLFDIQAQVENQCPIINVIQESLETHSNTAKDAYSKVKDVEGLEDVESDLDWLAHYLSGMKDELETLRTNIETLRSWGEEWKCVAIDLLEKDDEYIREFMPGKIEEKLDEAIKNKNI